MQCRSVFVLNFALMNRKTDDKYASA